ncbi:MAG: GGDEF domain-containing protein [Rhodospirillales bacterium]|nr:GGDEF domain-containing protein [Rhodospirillales bacterium]
MIERVMHGDLLAMYRRWMQAVAGRANGAWPLDPRDCLAPYLDHLNIIEFRDSCYTYRHYGQTFRKAFDIDLTGQTIQLVPFDVIPRDQRHMMEFEYSYVSTVERPVWRSYTARFEQGIGTWQRLVLPMGDNLLAVGACEVPFGSSPGGAGDEGERLLRMVLETIPVCLDEQGNIVGVAISLREMAKSRSREEDLEHLATVDSLTGANNRRHFLHLASGELDKAHRHIRPLSVMMLDIDHFKKINDAYGHAAGDEALRRFTAICKDSLRKSDILGRLGGEEFAIALPETDSKGAAELAERLRRRFSEAEVAAAEHRFFFTVSIGIALAQDNERQIDEILKRADEALYRAKETGRNRVVVAEAGEAVDGE